MTGDVMVYILFEGENYYPVGGAEDIAHIFMPHDDPVGIAEAFPVGRYVPEWRELVAVLEGCEYRVLARWERCEPVGPGDVVWKRVEA